MTKTFENGPHVAVGAPPQSSPSPPTPSTEATAKPPPVRSKAVYNAVCTTSTSTSASGGASAVLMSTSENHHVNITNANANTTTNSLAEEDSVTNLDELKLRALLDEAITYKTPKDRETKSKLFNTLLIDAEDNLRKEHAHNASGPARHFSSTAKKRQRQRRQPSSVSENLTHGGSLNDLAKQDLYEYESAKIQRPKTVSTRQREGGSLPCNVNAGAPHVDKAYFMEERARQQEQRNRRAGADDMSAKCEPMDTTPLESTFISKASIPITAKVDDPVPFPALSNSIAGSNAIHNADGTLRLSNLKLQPTALQHHGLVPKKLDENDNALLLSATLGGANSSSSATATANTKRKAKQKKTTENVINAADIKGHRADIIKDIDKLVSFIEGTEDKVKKKLHKQHSQTLANEDKTKSKRQRKKSSSMLHKSNSMEEMSTTKLEEFSCRFEALDVKEKAPLRPTKSNADRQSRLHKTWVVSSEQLQMPASSTSAENVEIADFIYVTKKKKSKKRRNSLGSRGNPPQSASETRPAEFHSLRVSSPRRKSASSAPHSEKSGDSSDNESVHSLPLDGEHKSQISYADIAKSSERPKWNRLPSERRKLSDEKPIDVPPAAVAPTIITQTIQTSTLNAHANATTNMNLNPLPAPPPQTLTAIPPTANNQTVSQQEANKDAAASAAGSLAKTVACNKEKETDTDLSSLQNWPEIRNNKVNQAKTNSSATAHVVVDAAQQTVQLQAQSQSQPVQDWPSIISNGAKQPQQQPPQAKHMDKDNKAKKGGGKVPPQSANEHLQQVLQVQVQVVPSNPAYIFRHDPQDEVIINNPQQVIQQVSEQSQSQLYQMPPNIRDVQSIEEMQIRSLQAAQMSPALPEAEEDDEVYVPHGPHVNVNMSVSVGEKHRPAVVILSSGGDRHATSDITFGFGINEQLLSGDVCADFVSRFLQPEVTTRTTTQVDQLVSYVGSEWENILMQTHTGKVKYYTDELV